MHETFIIRIKLFIKIYSFISDHLITYFRLFWYLKAHLDSLKIVLFQ